MRLQLLTILAIRQNIAYLQTNQIAHTLVYNHIMNAVLHACMHRFSIHVGKINMIYCLTCVICIANST